MSRDDFDLSDFGEMDEPSFPADDAEFLPPDAAPGGGRAPRNTTFLIVAVILVIVFILGLLGITLVIIGQQGVQAAYNQTATVIALTNNYVQTAIHATETAKAWTLTPSYTPTFTETATFTPSTTPTITPSPSETPVTPATTGTVVSVLPTGPSDTPGGPTDTLEAITATALGINDLANTKAAMDKTNAAATCIANPQLCAGGPVTATRVGGVSPTAVALVGSATVTKLPKDGLFEDMAAGKASPDSLAFVGLAALVLVGVIFASRKLRIK